jgi:serpin B
VLKKAYIAVDEDGTEAAAATAVTAIAASAVTQSVPFVVDHPFLLFIRDADGAALFSGQVTDPSQP